MEREIGRREKITSITARRNKEGERKGWKKEDEVKKKKKAEGERK